MISIASVLRKVLAAVLLGLAFFAGPVLAEFPDKPIRVVVPFSPGGGTDLIARLLGDGMARALGQPIVIVNKPGAGTVIGTDMVAKSAPDGYTLVIATFAHAINPSLLPKLPFDPATAFTPVSLIATGPNVLVVRSESPFKSVKDILDALKSGQKLSYASQGNGTSAHLAGEMFTNLAKVEMLHIPYKGAGPAMTDLLGGRVDMFFGTVAAVSGFVSQGKLRALAVTTTEPSAGFPGVPALASIVPGYSVESWYGFLAPAGTPAAVVAKLNDAVKKAAQGSEFVGKVRPEGLIIKASEPAAFDQYLAAEESRWKKVIKENNIKVN